MLRIAAADVLPTADIGRRSERLEDVVVVEPEEDAVVADGRLGDNARLVDVEVLERVVHLAVGHLVTVVVAARAAGTSLRDFVGEQLLASCDLSSRRIVGELLERVRQQPRFVLRPQDLCERHVVEADAERIPAEIASPDRPRILGSLFLHERVARPQPIRERGLREHRRPPLGVDELAVAARRVAVHVIEQPFEPLRPVVGEILVLRHRLRSAHGVAADVPGVAVVTALPVAVAARLLSVVGVRLREQPPQADFFVRGEQMIAVAAFDRIRR